MKIALLFLFALINTSTIKWEPSFDNAKKIAKEKHQLILLNFSGSDWCGPCMLFRKDFLESKVFTNMADSDLVLVNADFPRKKKNMPTKEIKKQNDLLAEKYNKEGNFPITVLLTNDGKVLKTWNGKPSYSAEQFTKEIKMLCIANKK